MTVAAAVSTQIGQSAIRQFSARAPRPTTRVQQAVSMGIITTGVLMPFIPPAIESQKEKKLGNPNTGKAHAPLCCHAR